MTIDNWVRHLTGREQIIGNSLVASLSAYKRQYDEYLEQVHHSLAAQNSQLDAQCGCDGNSLLQAAYKLECDPLVIMERECELMDELVRLARLHRQQVDMNNDIRHKIENINELKRQYEEETRTSLLPSTLSDTINVLKHKTNEYQRLISESEHAQNDINILHDVVLLMEEYELLGKQLYEYQNLPGDLSEALLMIARLEAELIDME